VEEDGHAEPTGQGAHGRTDLAEVVGDEDVRPEGLDRPCDLLEGVVNREMGGHEVAVLQELARGDRAGPPTSGRHRAQHLVGVRGARGGRVLRDQAELLHETPCILRHEAAHLVARRGGSSRDPEEGSDVAEVGHEPHHGDPHRTLPVGASIHREDVPRWMASLRPAGAAPPSGRSVVRVLQYTICSKRVPPLSSPRGPPVARDRPHGTPDEDPTVTDEASIHHHFTVDVEEAFHSTALKTLVPREAWDDLPRRAAAVVPPLLEELARRKIRATFFVLGWLARREPDLVRRIADEGHEIASHSMHHRRVVELTPGAFRASVRDSKALLEDLTGREVVGYRAPSFSILPGCEWAFDILLEEGYRYDSSLFPTSLHPDYGYPSPPDPHWIERPAGALFEVPLATLRIAGLRLPAAGGAYLRFFPRLLVSSALRQAAARGRPGTVYVHPWDLDPGQTRLPLPARLRIRLYAGSRAARRRLPRLLDGASFRTIEDTLHAAAPPSSTPARDPL